MNPLGKRVQERLRCPACHGSLTTGPDVLRCAEASCAREFPVVDGVPVLLDNEVSVMSTSDYLPTASDVLSPAGRARSVSPLRKLARGLYGRLPGATANVGTRENYDVFARCLLELKPDPLVLVVGGREVGKGMDDLLQRPGIEFVETDIDFGDRTRIICDGHQLPFAEGSVDGVVVQAVLEHVLDPHRVVAEIHRVLSPKGIVYAETPFLFRRHGGPFDFTRFTYLGHRRLFRRFEEIHSGIAVGPGSALAVMYMGFLLSLTRRRALRVPLRIFGSLTSFWLKYLDPILARNEVAYDVSAGFSFIGRRSTEVLSDRELIKLYRGLR